MRMHPRRRGAYNTSARFASAFTNAYFKNKKRKQRLKELNKNNETPVPLNNSDSIGCLGVLGVLSFIIILIKACSV